MTAMTVAPERTVRTTDRVRFGNIVRSEWIKLTSLRLDVLALVAIVVAGLGLSLALSLFIEEAGKPDQFSVKFVLDNIAFGLVLFGQVVAALLGALMAGSEYSSGTIQTTLLAVPHRGRMLLAKALVAFGAVTVTALVTVFASWAITYPLYAEFGLQANLTSAGFVPALIGAAVYLGLCAVFGVGIGAVVRSTAGGAIAVFSLLLLAPILWGLLPRTTVVQTIGLGFLQKAGAAMSSAPVAGMGFGSPSTGQLNHVGGWAIAVVWAAVALIAGVITLRGRDA